VKAYTKMEPELTNNQKKISNNNSNEYTKTKYLKKMEKKFVYGKR
jgi:hypothetical protein